MLRSQMLFCALQAFATLQEAYSLLLQHHQQHQKTEEEAGHGHITDKPAASSSNRLLLTALEVPGTCWHLLPQHLQARATGVPCPYPFLALPILGQPDLQRQHESDMQNEAMRSAEHCEQYKNARDSQSCGPDMPSSNEYTHQQHPPLGMVTSQQSLDLRSDTGGDTVLESKPCNQTAAGWMGMSRDSMTGGIAGKSNTAGTAGTAGTASTAWTPGIQQPKEAAKTLQWQPKCAEGVGVQEAVKGSKKLKLALLVPCRKAMQNCFPLNGTFFQVNEVFLDQDTLLNPLEVSVFACAISKHMCVTNVGYQTRKTAAVDL